MIERESEYRLKPARVQARALLYGACALFMAFMGLTNDRGLILLVFRFSPVNATIFYWVTAALAAAFCIGDVYSANRGGALRQRVALTREGLVLPKSQWTEEEHTVPYEHIVKLTTFDDPDGLVIIRHLAGGELILRLDMFSDERAFGEFVQGLSAAVAAAQENAERGGGQDATSSGGESCRG
jgi:hypothetical protein